MSDPRVFVTGLGCVGAHGTDLDALAALLAAGIAPVRPLALDPAYASEARPTGRRGVVCAADLDLADWLPRSARRMSASSKFAVAAARLARLDAGEPEFDPADTIVACGTAFGPTGYTEKIATTIFATSPVQVSPFQFTDCVANAAAGQIAIDQGVRGGNWTTCQREAGAVLALLRVFDEVRRGRATAGIAATVDEAHPLVHATFDRFHALARGADEAARPFDLRRDGFLFGEGATACWLARDAGAGTRAEVVAGVRAFDPSAPPHDHGVDGAGLAKRLCAGLARAAVPLVSIECVVSGAAGTRRGDRLEAQVLREAFGHEGLPVPPVVTPKAVLGEHGMGIVGAAVLLLGGRPIARPVACTMPDLELGVEAAGWTDRRPPCRVLLTGLATGGAAAWAVLDHVTTDGAHQND